MAHIIAGGVTLRFNHLPMTPEAYQLRISRPDVLDHTTLNVTLKELAFVKQETLVSALQRVLSEGLIEKPAAHNAPHDTSPNHYVVDLDGPQVETIIDLLNDLEEQSAGADGAATPLSNFYSALADKWSALC